MTRWMLSTLAGATIVGVSGTSLWLAQRMDELGAPAPLLAAAGASEEDRALLLEADRELSFVQAWALLGIQRARSAHTRRLAVEQLRQAHEAGDALEAVAGEQQVELAHRLGAADREAIERLVLAPPGQFDQRFAEGLADSHHRQIERLHAAGRSSGDPRIRWWSQTALDARLAARERIAGLLPQP